MAKKKPTFPNRPCPKCGEPIHIKSKKHDACGSRADDAAAVNKASAASDNGETTGGYFRRIFKESPQLLKGRSNEEVLKRWLTDHPGYTEVPKNIKAHLSNVKSTLRSKKRNKVASREENAQVVNTAMKRVSRVASGSSKLEGLEFQIDECLIAAKQLDREELQDVIDHLRRARNAVVWKLGQ